MNRSAGKGSRFGQIWRFGLSCVVLGGIGLVGAELVCRALGNASFLGNSRYLSVPGVYGSTKGNMPLANAVSLGVRVFTDSQGFRVPPRFRDRKPADAPALLILGDSVAFGSGVEEEQTFAGLLRASLPSTRIYNAAVIGYGASDYRNFVSHFLPDHSEVRTICLIFCLNDVRERSLSDDQSISVPSLEPIREPPTLTAKLDSVLRANSELYIVLKSELTDPQERYWQLAASAYTDGSKLKQKLQPIAQIAEISRILGARFFVVIAPYEFQLRKSETDATAPQRALADYFEQQGIAYVDALPVFRRVDLPSYELFLPGNAMHFSAAGHELIHEIILATLDRR